MCWQPKAIKKLCAEVEKNRCAINDLTKELRKVESKTETMLVEKDWLPRQRTILLPTSKVVRMILDYLELQVVHREESTSLERKEE